MPGTPEEIRAELEGWLRQFEPPIVIWSDCYAYDWVFFLELFGGAFQKPEGIYYIPFDLSTTLLLAGVDPDIQREEFAQFTNQEVQAMYRRVPENFLFRVGTKHNALWDALVQEKCWSCLQKEGKWDFEALTGRLICDDI